jgi:hypothetical protein
LPAPRDVFQQIEAALAGRQWDAAADLARKLGADALAKKQGRVALRAGAILERLDKHGPAAHLLAAGGRLLHPSPLPEWNGAPLDGTLLIIQRLRHVGAAIRLAGFIQLAAQRVKRCIVVAEPRLVPLYRRSFPGVEVHVDGPDSEALASQADAIASYETLTEHLWDSDLDRPMSRGLLKPDPAAVAAFRRKYGSGPLIGFSWHSTNEQKELPSLETWSALIKAVPGTFVSIQYGDVLADVERMQELSGRDIVFDGAVDSLTNLDLFAAQVAALDLVLTISNTGAHMCGAVGVPLYLLLDDKNHLVWPLHGRKTAWYRDAELIRKDGRSWPQVFEELLVLLEGAGVPITEGAPHSARPRREPAPSR